MKTSAIDASITPSLTRSVIESTNAPNGVAFPLVRASAPSRMSRIEPTMKRAAPIQKAASSLWSSKLTTIAPAVHSSTPPAVSVFGVTRERASPLIDRAAIRRTPVVYPAFTRPRASLRAIRRTLRPDEGGAQLRAVHERAGRDRKSYAGDDVEPEVVAGRHDREPDPDGPGEPQGLRPGAAHDRRHHDSHDQRVGGVEARHGGVRVGRELDEAAAVVEPAERRQGVDEPELREHPRRRGRNQHVAEQAEDVREHDRVAEAREGP